MFSTTDDRIFYVSEAVGLIIQAQLTKLRVVPNEPIEICKREVVKGNRRSIEWQVYRVGFAAGEQGDGTFVVPANGKAAGGGDSAAAAAPGVQSHHSNTNNGNGSRPYQAAGIPAPSMKIPMNIAVREAVQMVRDAMVATGEQWSDASRQGLVSTILIGGQREGWISMWERPETGARNAA